MSPQLAPAPGPSGGSILKTQSRENLFDKWEDWGSETKRDLPKSTQRGRSEPGLRPLHRRFRRGSWLMGAWGRGWGCRQLGGRGPQARAVGRRVSLGHRKGDQQAQQVHVCPPLSCPRATRKCQCHTAGEARTLWAGPARCRGPAASSAGRGSCVASGPLFTFSELSAPIRVTKILVV